MRQSMSINQLIDYINSDFYRKGRVNFRNKLLGFFRDESLRYLFYLRCVKFFQNRNKFFYFIFKYLHSSLGKKYGVKIPIETDIGYGLYLNYFNGIYINGGSKIGNNCNISHQVTIAKDNRKNGYPILGDNIYVAPGVKIVGG